MLIERAGHISFFYKMFVSIIWRERNKEVNLEIGEPFDFISLLLNINTSVNYLAYELRILQGDGAVFKVFTTFFIFEDKLQMLRIEIYF